MTAGTALSYYAQRFRAIAAQLDGKRAETRPETEARGILDGAIEAYKGAASSIEREDHRSC